MSSDRRPLFLAIAAAAAAAVLARPHLAAACGPDFPESLLADRGATLGELEEGVFLDDVTRLVPAPDPPYTILDDGEPYDARQAGSAAERELYDRGAAAFKANHDAEALAAFTQL